MAAGATTCIDAAARYALAREVCPGLSVLDIGCGDGYGARLLTSWGAASVTGVDVAPRPERIPPGILTLRADASAPGALSRIGTFDLVLALGVMEEAMDAAGLLATVRRTMAAGGMAIVTCPADDGGPAAAAAAFSRLVAGTLGKPTQILFALPASGLLVLDPERAALAPPATGGILDQEEVHSTTRVGDPRPALRGATMVVGVWGARLPDCCVVAPEIPEAETRPAPTTRRRRFLDRVLGRG